MGSVVLIGSKSFSLLSVLPYIRYLMILRDYLICNKQTEGYKAKQKKIK